MRVWIERNRLLILGLAAIAFLASFLLLSLLDQGPPPVEFRYDAGLPRGTPIRVHVTGAVQEPGVYDLRAGHRVIEAIAAAGGPTAAADEQALNLARPVRDGERVVVPRQGTASETLGLTPGQRLDINTASAAQLDDLPGIGEAYSRRIVDSRTVDGPFETTADLVERRVLPRATYDRIQHLIMTGP